MLTWVVGLVIGAPDVTADDSGADIVAAYSHAPAALFQAVLVHGIAGVLIAAVATLNARRLSLPRKIAAVVVGVIAAALSLMQLAGELALMQEITDADAAAAWSAVTICDGAKMLVLAGLAGIFATRDRGTAFRVFSFGTLAALVVSGAGSLILQPTLMLAAFASLPLLLIWAIWVSIGPKRQGAASTR